MNSAIFDRTDEWLRGNGDAGHIAISSRVRYARNLAGFPFAPHARPDVLERIHKFIAEAIERSEALSRYERVHLDELSTNDRSYLKESRLISKEMERGGEHLVAYISPDARSSILVNEEDHIRMQILAPGLGIDGVLDQLNEMDQAIAEVVGYAWSGKYGFLTACPTNVGTGFRASVMMHLPGLTMMREIENSLQGIAHHGLTVRGFYGENSDYAGDFYQISNEVTLGMKVEEIVDVLNTVVQRLMEREEEARLELFRHHAPATNDSIWRSYAILSHAMRMDSSEAMRLLSRIRLGIDRGYFKSVEHADLNRLVVDIQPAHLERKRLQDQESSSRDELRARYLRSRFRGAGSLEGWLETEHGKQN